jgi:hypothetical protein
VSPAPASHCLAWSKSAASVSSLMQRDLVIKQRVGMPPYARARTKPKANMCLKFRCDDGLPQALHSLILKAVSSRVIRLF